MSWRTLTPQDREDFLLMVSTTMAQRQQVGREAYGDQFQGDPLDHALEEMLDGLFYIWMARRQRDALAWGHPSGRGEPDNAEIEQLQTKKIKRLFATALRIANSDGKNPGTTRYSEDVIQRIAAQYAKDALGD